ncbi:MAG: alkaline phosphatase, partial [Fidelibacterota bacterium]
APARFEHVGIVTTQPSNGDIKVTDSAAGGTALATGYKTYNGAISVDQNHQPLKTVVEWAEEYGMATGLVATSTISHATPASFGAHVDSRQKEAEISRQLAESSIDVLFGGGSKYWNPDLFDEVRKSGGQVISDISETVDRDRRVVGLFSSEGMPTANGGRSPSTLQMAKKAIEIIEKDPDGFFIMIEESQVDWGGHSQSADYIFGEMKSLNRVVNFCLDYQRSHPDVLVVLTSDHETGGCAVNDGENGELEIQFTDDHHTANFVPVWASGPGSQAFDAFQDNTEIGKTLIRYIRNK